MAGVLCSMVGASFVTAAAEVIRRKLGITAIGNAQIDTAQSQFGGASALFDGNGDYLYSTTGISLGTGDWTIECWIRTGTANRVFFDNRWPGASSAGVLFFNASGHPSYYDNETSSIVAATNCADSTWRHIAYSKSGTTLRIFVNGTVGATYNGYVSNMGTNRTFSIGGPWNLDQFWNGHIDEFRISNSARYTANFTPSTTPFVNDANTLFLMHANGTDASTFFEDDNGVRNQKGLVAIGSAQISTTQSKFGGTSLFPNTGYISTPYQSDLTITGNYTIECWLYATTVDGNYRNFYSQNDGGANYISFVYQSSNGWGAEWAHSGGVYGFYRTGSSPLNTWRHFAFVKNGSTCSIYVDGTLMGATYSAGDGKVLSSDVRIGQFSSSSNGWAGYIDEVRISNSARYTANFTAPTEPFVNDANTLLLIHADGTDATTVFRDDNGVRAPRGITAIGNAQIDTAQSQIGGSSLLLDGIGDYLQTSTGINIASSNVTIECWYRPTSKAQDYPVVICNYPDYTPNTNTWVLLDRHKDVSNTKFSFWVFNHNSFSAPLLSSSTSVSNNTWYHLAVVRNSNTWTLYVNGVAEATATFSGSLDGSATPRIGIGRGNVGGTAVAGYIDELRISKTARYTANFTAPTQPFQNDANTELLLHMDGTDASTVFFDDNGIAPYTP